MAINGKGRPKDPNAKTKDQTRNSETAKGKGYKLVRSKHLKGKDGYGRLVQADREAHLDKNGGKDPGKDKVIAHKNPGSHKTPGDGYTLKTRAENTAESNSYRSNLRKRRKDAGK
jgi:hypothetical protein